MATAAGGTPDLSALQFRLSRLKVPQLKSMLIKLELRRGGKKTDLIERLLEWAQHASEGSRAFEKLDTMISTIARESLHWGTLQSASYRGPLAQRSSHSELGTLVARTDSATFPPSPFYKLVRVVKEANLISNHSAANAGSWNPPPFKTIWSAVEDEVKTMMKAKPALQLQLRCGRLPDGVTGGQAILEERFPKMVRWDLNARTVKEATASRYCAIDLHQYLSCDVTKTPLTQPIKIDLWQMNRFDPIKNGELARYKVMISLVEPIPADAVIAQVKSQTWSRDECFHQLLGAVKENLDNSDSEISLGKFLLKLRCPLSQMRIETPVRTVKCKHVQCFDANFFISMNGRRGTWQCPICNVEARPEHLRVDLWSAEVLVATDAATREIELKSDGSWVAIVPDDKPAAPRRDVSGKRKREAAPSAGNRAQRRAGGAAGSDLRGAPDLPEFGSSLVGPSARSGTSGTSDWVNAALSNRQPQHRIQPEAGRLVQALGSVLSTLNDEPHEPSHEAYESILHQLMSGWGEPDFMSRSVVGGRRHVEGSAASSAEDVDTSRGAADNPICILDSDGE